MSGLDEKAIAIAEAAYMATPEGEDGLRVFLRAYLASATPADVGDEPVAPDIDWVTTAHVFCDRLGIERKAEAEHICTALERVTRERDEARARLQTAYQVKAEMNDLANAERHARLAAEAKLAEARKVIEPFANCAIDKADFPLGEDYEAARRWIEETK